MNDPISPPGPEGEGEAKTEPEAPPTEPPVLDPTLDAQVEPYEGAVDDEVGREAFAKGREVEVSQYSPAKTRESMRVGLGIAIVAGALVAGAAGGISAAASGSGTETILTGVFSPMLGLAGAVIGFYFGGKDSSV